MGRRFPIDDIAEQGDTMDEFISLDRRDMLKTSTGLLAGLVVAGSPLAMIARGKAWAVDLTALTSSEGATLLSVARTIAPHDKLDDAAYALVIQAIDRDASKEQSTRKMIKRVAPSELVRAVRST